MAMWVRVATLIPALLSGAPAHADRQTGITEFVRDHHLTRYSLALTDLNGDGQAEVLLYAMAAKEGGSERSLCGSGGCQLNVLALTKTRYRQITRISVTRPPIRILRTMTHGWHDIGVFVSGGGIHLGYEAQLGFDGSTYPSNPTAPPAIRSEGADGEVVIDTEAVVFR